MPHEFEILYEDNHLLVISKPPGLVTQGASDGKSVVNWAKAYVKRKFNKPGNVYIGIVSRLDKLVGGVLVLARTSKAAARLSAQFRSNQVGKDYLAIVEGVPEINSPESEIRHWLIKSEKQQRMLAHSRPTDGALESALRLSILDQSPDQALLSVALLTGRKHQIRTQLSALGHPIVGDRKYGSATPWTNGIGLHAYRLQFAHPTTQEPMQFTSVPPPSWRRSGLCIPNQ